MNILGIDFEDWYHPELVNQHLNENEKKPIMAKHIDKILEWLNENKTSATFFLVGELIKNEPSLIDKIFSEGHEIGFHTMDHKRIDIKGSKEKFSEEIKEFANLTNKKSKGFRAPTFSLNKKSAWLIDSLVENNYLYDSSVVPIKTRLYGIPNAPKIPYRISSNSLDADDELGKIIEFPILSGKFLGKSIPAGGGFYLRFLPMYIIKNIIRKNEEENNPCTFYIHSWELLAEYMPRIKLPRKEKFVTYYNIEKAKIKMTKIIQEFQFTSFEKFMKNNKTNFL